MAGSAESGIHAHLIDEQEDIEDVKKQNVELLREIAELCHQRDEVENIFLLGKSGCGKSALINTVIKVVAGKYIPKAKVGSGARQSKTLVLERFQSCGVVKEDLSLNTQRDTVEKLLPKLPTIFDAAGRDCENTNDKTKQDGKKRDGKKGVEEDDVEENDVEEILELFIGGFIPPNTSIEDLEKHQKKYGVGCLRDTFYTESRQEWKMTKVVFVQSGRDTVPEGLISCLDTILRKTDPRTAQPKYPIDVFVVITKYDLVKDSDHFKKSGGPNDGYISMKDFKETEDKVAKAFSVEGARRDNMIRWTSYNDRNASDKNPYDNPYIDNIALKFLKRMVSPGNTKPVQVQPVFTPWKLFTLEAKKKWNQAVKNWSVINVIVCVLMVLVAILLFKLLNAKPI